jgi:hypothetical protein
MKQSPHVRGYVCLVVAVVILAIAFGSVPAQAKKVKKTEEHKKEVAVDNQTKVYIKNARGATKVVGKEGLDLIVVQAVKNIWAGDEEEAAKLLKHLKFEIEESNNTISIVTHLPDEYVEKKGILGLFSKLKQKAYINYYIEVPASMDVHVASTSGDIDIVRVNGIARAQCTSGDVNLKSIGNDVIVELTSGNIIANGIGGNAKIATASGDADLTNITGTLHLGTASGDVIIQSVGGNSEVGLVSGDVEFNGCGGNVSVGTASGDIILKDINGSIEANSSSGDIIVLINPSSVFNYSFTTASGDVVVDYLTPEDYGFLLEVTTGSGSIGGDLAISVEKISRRYLKGTVGSGKATLKIMTASGDVRVQEKD